MSNTKKIVILSWEIFPIYAGGLGVLTLDLVDELRKQGADVTVLIPHKKKNSENVHIISLEQKTKSYYKKNAKVPNFHCKVDHFRPTNRNPLASIPAMFSSGKNPSTQNLYPNHTPLLTQAFAFAIQDYLKDQKVDIIIGMDWMSIAFFALLKDNLNRPPFWFYINSTEPDRTNSIKFTGTAKAIFELEEEYLPQADKVIAISNVTKNIIVETYKVKESNTLVISNHVNFSPQTKGFPELDKGKNVLFIGRFAPQKGLSFLLDTAERVLSFDRGVKFLLAGDGEQLADVVTSVCERQLENNVLFTGWLNMEQKKQLYRSGDLFVMSSPSEPFGLTPLEAIISGVPVISSKSCGFLDVIPSTPTFDYHDTNAFAELILYYLQNPQKAKELIQNQKKDLEKHDWSREVKKILDEITKY
jgi:glycogen synthase